MKDAKNKYQSYEQLPLSLNAEDVSEILNISIGKAYNLFHRADFPTIHLGKRMIVPRDRFLAWIDKQFEGMEI